MATTQADTPLRAIILPAPLDFTADDLKTTDSKGVGSRSAEVLARIKADILYLHLIGCNVHSHRAEERSVDNEAIINALKRQEFDASLEKRREVECNCNARRDSRNYDMCSCVATERLYYVVRWPKAN